MELVCPVCGEAAKRGTPLDKNVQMPRDRLNYMHPDRTALCAVLGLTAQGISGYIPALPIESRG